MTVGYGSLIALQSFADGKVIMFLIRSYLSLTESFFLIRTNHELYDVTDNNPPVRAFRDRTYSGAH